MPEKKFNGLLFAVVIGLIIAGGTFFMVFISTQKASEENNKYKNLKLRPIVVPSPRSLPALKGNPVITLPSSPSANQSLPSPLSSPAASSQLKSSPSATLLP